jgi:hypothetical protein
LRGARTGDRGDDDRRVTHQYGARNGVGHRFLPPLAVLEAPNSKGARGRTG